VTRVRDDKPLFFSCVLTDSALTFRSGFSPFGGETGKEEIRRIVFQRQ
jgi:hypothetical protein